MNKIVSFLYVCVITKKIALFVNPPPPSQNRSYGLD